MPKIPQPEQAFGGRARPNVHAHIQHRQPTPTHTHTDTRTRTHSRIHTFPSLFAGPAKHRRPCPRLNFTQEGARAHACQRPRPQPPYKQLAPHRLPCVTPLVTPLSPRSDAPCHPCASSLPPPGHPLGPSCHPLVPPCSHLGSPLSPWQQRVEKVGQG